MVMMVERVVEDRWLAVVGLFVVRRDVFRGMEIGLNGYLGTLSERMGKGPQWHCG